MSIPLVPADFRHATQAGDFELESMSVEDALVTVYQPGGQRPYNVSIFHASIGPMRKRWLFYDLMSAEAITGQFDNCLFSLHMPQKLGKVKTEDGEVAKRMVNRPVTACLSPSLMSLQARFRVDGLPIEHAQYVTGHTGPIAWITSGKLDAVLDIKFPRHPEDEVDFKAIFEEIGRNVATITQQGAHSNDAKEGDGSSTLDHILAAASGSAGLIPGQHRLARPPLRSPTAIERNADMERRQVTVDVDLRFRDLKAAVPMFTSDLSVRNQALIRPIVAFIKSVCLSSARMKNAHID